MIGLIKFLLTWVLLVLSGWATIQCLKSETFIVFDFMWVPFLIPACLQYALHFIINPGKLDIFIVFAIINTTFAVIFAAIAFYFYFSGKGYF